MVTKEIDAIDAVAFEYVYQDWLAHRETCPSNSGVCSCSFPFRCRTCGRAVPAQGEDLPQYKDFGNGQCQGCFFDPDYQGRQSMNSEIEKSPREIAEAAVVDECQRRMDAVVEAAVEWHQSGQEGDGSWFEKSETLSRAIESLLAARTTAECFCGTDLEAGLCPNGHDPVTSRTDAAGEWRYTRLEAKTPNLPACWLITSEDNFPIAEAYSEQDAAQIVANRASAIKGKSK